MEDLLIGLLGETASPGMRYSNGFPYRIFTCAELILEGGIGGSTTCISMSKTTSHHLNQSLRSRGSVAFKESIPYEQSNSVDSIAALRLDQSTKLHMSNLYSLIGRLRTSEMEPQYRGHGQNFLQWQGCQPIFA